MRGRQSRTLFSSLMLITSSCKKTVGLLLSSLLDNHLLVLSDCKTNPNTFKIRSVTATDEVRENDYCAHVINNNIHNV